MAFAPGIVPPPSTSIDRRVWFLVHRKGVVVREGSLPGDEDARALGIDPAAAHYLGRLDDAEAFAAPFEGAPPPPFAIAGLRDSFAMLGEERFFVAGRATQIVEWATTHRFCGRCATPTERVDGERCMRCPSCQLTAYPRIAPAVIVLVRRGEEALLARGARFPLPFYSTLAGFSEVGESLEETVAREVREEVGVEVKDVRYFGSQPWPFPHSLMIGFVAWWAGGEIRIEEKEILDAKWFTRETLPMIPPPLSIARRLIDSWLLEAR